MKNVNLNIPSHLDLPEYKTSSTTVRPDWSNYTWTIVAEFFYPSDAYTFEQQLICDNWENPLLLNGYYRLGKIKQFRKSGGPTGKQRNPSKKPSHLKGKPNPRKGIPNGRKGIPSPLKGKPSPLKGIPSGKKGIPNGRKGIPTGPSPLKGKPSPLKGIPSGKKGIPTGPSPLKGKPSPLKGKPSPLKGKPSPLKGKPNGPAPKVECPHCGKIGGIGPMARWHFDTCPKKVDYSLSKRVSSSSSEMSAEQTGQYTISAES